MTVCLPGFVIPELHEKSPWHTYSLSRLPRGVGPAASWRKGHVRCTVSGRLASGDKEQMSNRASSYHQKGTEELSEIRGVYRTWVSPTVGLLSSLRQKL